MKEVLALIFILLEVQLAPAASLPIATGYAMIGILLLTIFFSSAHTHSTINARRGEKGIC